MILPEAANPLFLICFFIVSCIFHACLDPTKAHPINYIMGEFMREQHPFVDLSLHAKMSEHCKKVHQHGIV